MRLRDLLTTIAKNTDPALDVEVGANRIPDRYHLAHPSGDLVAAAAAIVREAPQLLAQLLADLPAEPAPKAGKKG